jgi:glutaredoxin
MTDIDKTTCAWCKREFARSAKKCPYCQRQNRLMSKIKVDMRGRMANNAAIEANMRRIVEFDKRYQAAMSARSVDEMQSLATWADENNLTLARKARMSAEEMTKHECISRVP